jgi:hypothetical protein
MQQCATLQDVLARLDSAIAMTEQAVRALSVVRGAEHVLALDVLLRLPPLLDKERKVV